MRIYFYFRRNDTTKEKLDKCIKISRASAAIHFAEKKRLPLKEFLKIYEVSK